MFYIILDGNKQYLNKEIFQKYNIKAGMHTPFTGYKIFKENEKEEIGSRNQKIYQAPEDGNSRIGQG